MSRGTRRAVLQELSARSVMEMRSDYNNIELMNSLLTPSPDEQVIQQRGRRNLSRTPLDNWIATGDLLDLMQTPTKPRTPTKATNPKIPTTPLRSSPRKRLILPDLLASPSKQSKAKVQSQLVKRQRIQRKLICTDVELSLKGLSHSQLVDMLLGVMNVHPDLKQELSTMMPLPDLNPLEERLNYLRSNIFKAFPHNRHSFVSKKDSFCFQRVSTHLNAFKKDCVEQGKHLLISQQWSSVIDYVLLAWTYVQRLPDWESPAHNKIKEQCFASLAIMCMKGLKKLTFDHEHYEDLLNRLEEAEAVCNEIGPCTNFVKKYLREA